MNCSNMFLEILLTVCLDNTDLQKKSVVSHIFDKFRFLGALNLKITSIFLFIV